uniref:Probable lysosomal cobalamin transporter n=1 Tax=Phallusia mammillata TaxID=59560 RepID=A0A6F9DKG5_9ASCI|nr:probable lysosomal cobalamin transporter [Phallusia mammillata]
MAIPWNVSFAAWLPFPIVSILGILVVLGYFVYYKGKFLCLSGIVSISVVVISICFIILLPVDVYLVSSTKDGHGAYMYWVDTETIISVESIVLYGYYGVYGLILLLTFGIVPFVYFTYPSHTSEEENNLNWMRGLKFVLGSLCILCVLLVTGAVIPMGDLPNKNSTLYKQLAFVTDLDCTQTVAENALIFTINLLGLIGMVCAIIYTAYGMVILPVNLIKGPPKEEEQQGDLNHSIEEIKEKIQEIMDKTSSGQPLAEDDRKTLMQYSAHLSRLQSESDAIRHQSYTCCAQISCFTRPLKIAAGCLLLLFAWFIIVTLIISNINRLISSHGMYTGYLLKTQTIFNPLDSLLILAHIAFPCDYIILVLVIGYFAVSSVSGMQHMGIWCLWIQLHRLRAGRTSAKALLFSSYVLAVVTMYAGVLAYSIAPQYVTYGTQMYQVPDDHPWSSMDVISPLPCSADAPADKCIMTRLMTLQTKLFYRMWFIGVAYFWCGWFFILVFVIAFIVAVVRSRKTIAVMLDTDAREDSESAERLIST